jgi:hypothetical protein
VCTTPRCMTPSSTFVDVVDGTMVRRCRHRRKDLLRCVTRPVETRLSMRPGQHAPATGAPRGAECGGASGDLEPSGSHVAGGPWRAPLVSRGRLRLSHEWVAAVAVAGPRAQPRGARQGRRAGVPRARRQFAPTCASCGPAGGNCRGRQAVDRHDHATGRCEVWSAAHATSASVTSTTTRRA